ncbi:hypothetical protein [Endozoicomonas sp. Mp262]|uniref:hypothetical protein n=1 Tax=Endozoicomonas sp. Mp262 TaxID=2919499 RepID=UPI0021D88604
MRYLKPNQHGQVTIPVDLCHQLGITQETHLKISLTEAGDILLTPATQAQQKPPIETPHKHFKLTMSHEELEKLINDGRSEVLVPKPRPVREP